MDKVTEEISEAAITDLGVYVDSDYIYSMQKSPSGKIKWNIVGSSDPYMKIVWNALISARKQLASQREQVLKHRGRNNDRSAGSTRTD
jgi:hypothetical protein